MGAFKDDSEVYQYIGGVFENGLADPEVGPKLKGSGRGDLLARYDRTKPP